MMNADKVKGLSQDEVDLRIKNNQVNYDTNVKTKSILDIVRCNLVTIFNILNISLSILIISVGSFKNALFLGTVFFNTLIGIVQEVRSKKIIDRLSLISSSKACVRRDNSDKMIDIHSIVLDDIVKYKLGNQVVCDSTIVSGSIYVNESLITGESTAIKKNCGDEILSGSFIESGEAYARVMHVGKDNYSSKIVEDAKYLKRINSEIMNSLVKFIKIVTIVIIPLGLSFFFKQLFLGGNSYSQSIINSVAAVAAMIPDGLMLLTSSVLAVSVIKLSRYNVLVQELYCIEVLARVNTICFDKTGTLTTGKMEIIDFIKFSEFDECKLMGEFLNNMPIDTDTIRAVNEKYQVRRDYKVLGVETFSSTTKYSMVEFDKLGKFYLGASDILINKFNIKNKKLDKCLDKYSDYRCLLFTKEDEVLGLFVIADTIRKESMDTINYFLENGVDVKIISGDSVRTVSRIARRLNFKFYDNYIDTSSLSDDEIREAAIKYSIFGRVTPYGKRIIIKAIHDSGRVVAMTGDGVNDVLALKESDCGISLSSGSDACRNVSDLVLLDSNFDSLPHIVLEGRKNINNVERSASLFITKTIYATLLIILFFFVDVSYPFVPIQSTLMSVFTIGIPSLILALEENNDVIRGNFFMNVVVCAMPSAISVIVNCIMVLIATSIFDLNYVMTSTLCVILTGFTGFMHIYKISRPINLFRGTLLVCMVSCFIIGVIKFNDFFYLTTVSPIFLILILVLMLFSYLFFLLFTKLFNQVLFKSRGKIE